MSVLCEKLEAWLVYKGQFSPRLLQLHLVGVQLDVLLFLKNTVNGGCEKPVQILHACHLEGRGGDSHMTTSNRGKSSSSYSLKLKLDTEGRTHL